jgi:hypothetical protein
MLFDLQLLGNPDAAGNADVSKIGTCLPEGATAVLPGVGIALPGFAARLAGAGIEYVRQSCSPVSAFRASAWSRAPRLSND